MRAPPAGDHPRTGRPPYFSNLDSDGCLSEVPGTPCAMQCSTWCWRPLFYPLHVAVVVLFLVALVSAVVFSPACHFVVLAHWLRRVGLKPRSREFLRSCPRTGRVGTATEDVRVTGSCSLAASILFHLVESPFRLLLCGSGWKAWSCWLSVSISLSVKFLHRKVFTRSVRCVGVCKRVYSHRPFF